MAEAAKLGEKNWYIINTYSMHEQKTADNIRKRIASMGMENEIFRVLVVEVVKVVQIVQIVNGAEIVLIAEIVLVAEVVPVFVIIFIVLVYDHAGGNESAAFRTASILLLDQLVIDFRVTVRAIHSHGEPP